MKKLICLTMMSCAVTMVAQQYKTYPSQMERLDRGVVALPAAQKGNFVSWRLLGTEPKGTSFDVLRDGKKIATALKVTNFVDADGTSQSRYQVVARGDKAETSAEVTPWTDLYRSIPLDRPQGGKVGGRSFQYTPNDCSVGDVDGDGQYELFLKWDPTNSQDNSRDGFTGDVIIDCMKLDGTKLWRINLGKNIRAGAHYTQFMVYDFNRDGRAELICKTAPGSVDGTGRFVSQAATDADIKKTDDAADYRNERGRILTGPEYLTIFDGQTGRAIHTVYYLPNRGLQLSGVAEYSEAWGDHANMGNRGERYLACVAWLDGPQHNPSAVMCRGYYTPSHLWAVDFDGKRLKTKWFHGSTSPNEYYVINSKGEQKWYRGLKATAYGQGAHSVSVGDVDGDGCDEITYGSAAINNDGTLLYSTGLGHGDAIHLSDLDPDRPGLEFFMVHEARPYGADLRDARTGELLYHETADEDTGRGVAADIDGNQRGFEFWHSAYQAVRNIKGELIGERNPAVNFRIYWDGDLQDELLANRGERPRFPSFLQKWDGEEGESLPLSNGKHFYEMGHSASCNWTKATPCLQADLFGDWREEIIFWDSSDAAHLNIFTTNIPTEYAVPTLMHDNIYRLGVAWQNTAYNQPPHLGYYLPDAMGLDPAKE